MFYGFLSERLPSHASGKKPSLSREGLHLFVDPSDGRSLHIEGSTATLAFRGRIYGAPETRETLENLLSRYERDRDTTKIFSELEGDFALILFDHARGIACLGRDRFARGEIYWSTRSPLAFFTHPGPFSRITRSSLELNKAALWDRFAMGGITPPETVYRDVHTTVTGEYVQVHPTGGVRRVPYWSPLQVVEEGGVPKTGDRNLLIRSLRETFLEKVAEEIAPYGKLGVGLSGGMDSAAILGAARTRFKGDIVAVTVGPEGSSSPDLPNARKSARFNDAHHVEFYPAAVDLDDFPGLMGRLPEPFRSASSFVSHQVSKRVRERGGEGVLWGFGADLILGNAGYCRRFFNREGADVPEILLNPFIRILESLPQNRPVVGLTNRLLWHRGPFEKRMGERYFRVCKKPRFFQEKRLFREDFLALDREGEILRRVKDILERKGDRIVERLIEADFKVVHMYHQVSGTHQVCRVNGLDALITYYNRDYAEMNLRATNEIRALDGWNKYLLREAFKPFVHEDIYHGHRRACVIRWDRIFSGAFREAVIRFLKSSRIIQEIFRVGYLDRLDRLIKHPGLMVLNLLGLALWHEAHFRGMDPETPLSEILDYRWQNRDQGED